MAWVITSIVFLVVTLGTVGGTFRSNLLPLVRVEGECSRYLRSLSEFVRVHTASHPKRQYFSDVSVFCQFRHCIVCMSMTCVLSPSELIAGCTALLYGPCVCHSGKFMRL
jgi:hypothetical protein